MEQEKKLYPFRFCTLKDEYGWGVEEFKLADLGYRDSLVADGWLAGNSIGEIMDMYMDRVVGENVFNRYGRQFPFEVKLLRVKGRTPLMVHPDDETASQRYDFLGKEKLWYVVSAGRDARLMIGFRKDTDASEVYEKCIDNTIDGIMNVIAPIEGQSFHIPPGTPHSACGDIVIAEISESSPLDFCMCGWGEEVSTDEFDESLNLVDALDFINYAQFKGDGGAHDHHHHHEGSLLHKLTDLPQFTVHKLDLRDPLHTYSGQFDSPVCYICIKGEASVQVKLSEELGNVPYVIKEGETLMVPAEVPDYIIAPLQTGTTLLETIVEKREEEDPYINPDAPASLDDDGSDCCDEDDDDCCCNEHHHHHHES